MYACMYVCLQCSSCGGSGYILCCCLLLGSVHQPSEGLDGSGSSRLGADSHSPSFKLHQVDAPATPAGHGSNTSTAEDLAECDAPLTHAGRGLNSAARESNTQEGVTDVADLDWGPWQFDAPV